jgi:hypothetical protein
MDTVFGTHAECVCVDGYVRNAVSGECARDPCTQLNACPAHSLCSSHSNGQHTCVCDLHYAMNASQCVLRRL